MTLNKLLAALVVTGITVTSQMAAAADGTIQINGEINAETCVPDVVSGGTGSIDLPIVASTSLAAANATAGVTPFTINLTGCTGSATLARASFESSSTSITPSGNLAIDGSSVATGVEIQIRDNSGAQINLATGDQTVVDAGNNASFAITGGAATLDYQAAYFTPTGTVTPGALTSSVAFTIQYN